MAELPKAEVVAQGMTVVEPNGDDGYLVMFPDGEVRGALDKAAAERLAKGWYRKALGKGAKVGIGQIEWR